MSSDVIARVQTLYEKAHELAEKGHLLRAAENYGRAAEVARALGADNVVEGHMRLQQGAMCAGHAAMARDTTGSDPRLLAACRAEYIARLTGATAALERRRAAGTLLEGMCSAAEEAWGVAMVHKRKCIHNGRPSATPDAVAASLATLVGYEEFLCAAFFVLPALRDPERYLASACSAEELQVFAQHVVQSTELMQQPRRHGNNTVMRYEHEFASMLRDVAGSDGLDAHLVQLLAGAWQQLERSGVLQARRIGKSIPLGAYHEAVTAAVERSMTAPGLRHCALPGCGAKEAHPAHFKSCAACHTVVFCCRDHQVEGWPTHKKACKAARKTTAAEDEAGPSGA